MMEKAVDHHLPFRIRNRPELVEPDPENERPNRQDRRSDPAKP
jgi:hypothetical protein